VKPFGSCRRIEFIHLGKAGRGIPVVAFVLPEVQRKYRNRNYTREQALLAAVEVMEAKIREKEVMTANHAWRSSMTSALDCAGAAQ
jgi:hypothetical protein